MVPLTTEALLELDPDILFVSEYVADGRAREVVEAPRISEDSRLSSLRAVRSGNVHVLPSAHVLATSHHVVALARDLCSALEAP
jgi:iron complex transport system substrate-binding protein